MAEAPERDLVALRVPDRADLLAAIEACWAAGEAPLPLPGDLPDALLERVLAVARPARFQTPGRVRPLSDPVPTRADLALLTSGTTGEPKVVELTRAALDASVRASLERIGSGPGDRWLLTLPLHHVAGILVLLRARATGGEPIVHPAFDPAALDRDRSATHVSLVPTQLARLLDAGVDLARFQRILLGGAAPPAGLLERARAAGASVTVTYGMTETCGGCIYDGVPLDGVSVRLDHDGRVLLRGPVLMRGYRNRPDLTASALRDGWLRTTDRGRFLPDGRLEVLGRLDDVVVTGGENVPAAEVAAVLLDHPKVAAARVRGRPDPEWGEVLVARCVPADPGDPPTLEELRRFVGERLGAVAAPRALEVVDDL